MLQLGVDGIKRNQQLSCPERERGLQVVAAIQWLVGEHVEQLMVEQVGARQLLMEEQVEASGLKEKKERRRWNIS